MSVKPERKFYVQCDFCDNAHNAREANSYAARVKAGVDGWVYVKDSGKGSSYDYCPPCFKSAEADVSLLATSERIDQVREEEAA